MKAANALYDAKNYVKAIEAYKAILRDNAATPGVKSKLANCYRLTNSFSAAQQYYSEVVNSAEKQPADMYNYAECLRINGSIPEAKKWYGEYVKTTPDDKPAADKLSSCTIYLDSASSMKCTDSGLLVFSAPDLGKTNRAVTFDASKIKISGEKTKDYFWDFDNTFYGTGSIVKHAFSENRPHTVRLYIVTEKDNSNSIHCASKVIDIKPGYKPAKDNLLEVQKQDAELRDKNNKKQQE